jgi:hypothetical protein
MNAMIVVSENAIVCAVNLIECGAMMNNRPPGITKQDEEDEMLAKFWADYGESLWVDPMEQEWMWDEKTN